MNEEQRRPNKEHSVRVPLVAGASLVEKIDDWSFSNRVRSRSEAIRKLVTIGLGIENENGPAATAIAPDREHDHSR